jgi:thiamine transport system substrate-binding protein
VTVTPGWSEAYGLFLEGEADMVLSYTTSPAYHLIAEDDDTKAALPSPRAITCRSRSPGIVAGTDSPNWRAVHGVHDHRRFQSVIPDDQLDVPRRHPRRGPARGVRHAAPARNLAAVHAEEAPPGAMRRWMWRRMALSR